MTPGWFSRKRKIDISKLPPIVAELNGKRECPHNCWNATMIYFGHGRVGFTDRDTMESWLSTFTKKDRYKRCTPGTILVLRENGMLIHTAVFVDKGLLWHKQGCSGHWEFITERDVYKVYPQADSAEYRLMKEE